MALSATLSNHFKYQCMKKLIDMDTDSIKVLLMRTGFTFNKDTHAALINIKTNSGALSLTFANAGNTITRAAGDFTTDGFVVGNYITTNSANANNQGPFLISVVSALVITVTTTAGGDPTLTDGVEATVTVTSNDELATGFGYTQDTKTQTFTLAEDDTLDRAVASADADIQWTAAGGSIGPTPGFILYDDTSADNTIIGFGSFGGESTATDGTNFTLQNVKVIYA